MNGDEDEILIASRKKAKTLRVRHVEGTTSAVLEFAGEIEVVRELAATLLERFPYLASEGLRAAEIGARRTRKILVRSSSKRCARLWLQQGTRCWYCEEKVELEDATIDHVVPKSRGGTNDEANLVMACHPCNQRKGSELPTKPKTPEALARLVALR